MEFVEMVMFENIETITGLYKLEALGDSKHPLRQLVINPLSIMPMCGVGRNILTMLLLYRSGKNKFEKFLYPDYAPNQHKNQMCYFASQSDI